MMVSIGESEREKRGYLITKRTCLSQWRGKWYNQKKLMIREIVLHKAEPTYNSIKVNECLTMNKILTIHR